MAAGKLFSSSKLEKTKKHVSKVKKEVEEFCRAVVAIASMNKRVSAVNYSPPSTSITIVIDSSAAGTKDRTNGPTQTFPTQSCTIKPVETIKTHLCLTSPVTSNAAADYRCTKENLSTNADVSHSAIVKSVNTRATRSCSKILQDHDGNQGVKLNNVTSENKTHSFSCICCRANSNGAKPKFKNHKRPDANQGQHTVKYNMSKVPQVLRNKFYLELLSQKAANEFNDLSSDTNSNVLNSFSWSENEDPMRNSSIWIPPSREQWWDCVEELTALCSEASLRWALSPKTLATLNEATSRSSSAFPIDSNDCDPSFKLDTPVPLTKEYIRERLDIDDPLRGYQIRHSEGGWLQGFVLWTNFTTWTRHFQWNSTRTESGLYDEEFDDHIGIRDDTGELADELEAQPRSGDPMQGGVVWSNMAEIGLVGGLGCGEYLLRMAMEDISRMGCYEYVVLQATETSWSFYEKFGFIRVGAVCKYGQSDELCGYRHWTYADERNLDQRHGGPSYMMAKKIRPHSIETYMNNPSLVPTTGVWQDLSDKVVSFKPTSLSWNKQDEYLLEHPNPYAAAIVELVKKGNAWWKQLDQETYRKLLSSRQISEARDCVNKRTQEFSLTFDSPTSRRNKRIKLPSIEMLPLNQSSLSTKKKSTVRKAPKVSKRAFNFTSAEKLQALSKTNLLLPSLAPESPLGEPIFRLGPGQKLLKQKFTDKPSAKDANPFFFNKVVTPKNGHGDEFYFVVHYEKSVNQLTLIQLEAHGKFLGKLSHRTRYRAVGRNTADKITLLRVAQGSDYDVVHSEMVTKTSCIHEEGWNLLTA